MSAWSEQDGGGQGGRRVGRRECQARSLEGQPEFLLPFNFFPRAKVRLAARPPEGGCGCARAGGRLRSGPPAALFTLALCTQHPAQSPPQPFLTLYPSVQQERQIPKRQNTLFIMASVPHPFS